MSDFVLPEKIMLCILTRLPVKSLLRFKSVCKRWRELFGTRKFMKMHHDQFSSYPQNQSLIIYNHNTYKDAYDEDMYFVSIDSGATEPACVYLPYNGSMEEDAGPKRFVGCCYGMICIGLAHGYALWNPALKLFKYVCNRSFLPVKKSVGFGYDAERDDFKVVALILSGEDRPLGAEVFSTKSNSRKIIKEGLQFRPLEGKNNAIFNGNSYWVADVGAQDESVLGLVRFDPSKMVFEMVPLSAIEMNKEVKLQVVDWKGFLGVLVYTTTAAATATNRDEFLLKSVDVWVMNDCGMMWKKIHTFKPMGMEMRVVSGFLHCCKSGKVVEFVNGKLVVIDSETGFVRCVNKISDVALPIYSDMCGYIEGLACVEGMKRFLDRKEESDRWEVEFQEAAAWLEQLIV